MNKLIAYIVGVPLVILITAVSIVVGIIVCVGFIILVPLMLMLIPLIDLYYGGDEKWSKTAVKYMEKMKN